MSIESRVRLCRMIEKMEQERGFCGRAGIVNASTMNGTPASGMKKDIERDKDIYISERG